MYVLFNFIRGVALGIEWPENNPDVRCVLHLFVVRFMFVSKEFYEADEE